MASARFYVDVDPVGYSSIEVNGREVTDEVHGFRAESVQGQPTVLTLYASAAGAITGEGIVQVESMPTDLGEHIAEWLGNLDPESVEKAAIDRSDFASSLTPALFAVLADLARGKC